MKKARIEPAAHANSGEGLISWEQYESEQLARCGDEARKLYGGRDLSESNWRPVVASAPKATKATKQARLDGK